MDTCAAELPNSSVNRRSRDPVSTNPATGLYRFTLGTSEHHKTELFLTVIEWIPLYSS